MNFNDQISLPVPDVKARRLTTGWLLLSLSALVIGGLFTILVVLSRTPFFDAIIPWNDFFHTALVVHVDLTVLVWFLAFSGVLWSYNNSIRCIYCGWLALALACLGTLLIIVSPFTGESFPLMNNYVPVLQSTTFFVGLGIFGFGFCLLIIRAIITSLTQPSQSKEEGVLRLGLFIAVIASFVAVFALLFSFIGIDEGFEGEAYYDRLFWGSGHVIQFSHTQLMLVVWIWLASISGARLRLSIRVIYLLFILGLSPVLTVPLIYLLTDVSSGEHLFLFIQLMKYGGALAAVPIGLATTFAVFEHWKPVSGFEIERNALFFSIILFGVGGSIGFLIKGSNVIIPAHYHGSIVGVTLAFMGLTYHLLPKLGFQRVTGRIARWQPGLYGSGQLMHITGLAWSGGYGVQRKTSGGLEQLEQVAGMGLMGLGGLISIIGGVSFLVLVFKAMKPTSQENISQAQSVQPSDRNIL
ncbi:MAG: cytochrome c oxidase subunit I [Gammaproteobacteria bacterium]|nr:cytochrome c oxidase subunit I [Gammaproteobacteria bacterium]